MALEVKMINAFQNWLVAKQYTKTTIKNYIGDINRYLNWASQNKVETTLFSVDTLSNYLSNISNDINYSRYLASLNLFCQFAISQGTIQSNPIKRAKKQITANPETTIPHLLMLFGKHLNTKNNSASTIKNYINDINQYYFWLQSEN